MKIESIRPIPIDPVMKEKIDAGSSATAQASHTKNKETSQPQRPLQNDLRSADEIQQDIAKINDQLESMNRSIRFSIDESTKDIVVKVVDENTGEVVMQIPPDEMLKLRERLSEMSGLLVREQV